VPGTVSRTRPSSELASSPADWETSVSTDSCIHVLLTLSIFDSRSPGCWPPIGYCSQKVAGTAQRSLVSRRPLESDVDRRVVHGAAIRCSVGANHNICGRSDRSLAEFDVSLYQWNGCRSSSLLVHEVTHWSLQVDCVMNPVGSYNVDVVHSRSAEITAAHASVSIQCHTSFSHFVLIPSSLSM
jgi:hypothetical protein